jgi:AraC family transcriptional regulator of adaptative response/methylated-DNA-[protein]-cysteine methyltransferase
MLPAQSDYSRIAAAIAYLRDRQTDNPDLEAAAREAGLSAFHFQRLFTRWAGISPKRFLQDLTHQAARDRLAASRPALDVATDLGLSGTGRLHDLFVTVDAMNPGEARAGGRGLDIRFGVHNTVFGLAGIGITRRGICALHFADNEEEAIEHIRADWPRATLIHSAHATAGIAAQLAGSLQTRQRTPLAVLLKGSNFQLQVWRALLRLPSGHLATYSDIATAIGQPRAARAVGNAIGRNRVAWLIPCHRVIRASGIVTGYRWGETRKQLMLGREAANANKLMGTKN